MIETVTRGRFAFPELAFPGSNGCSMRVSLRRLVLVDRDYVELNNLQRQWLYNEEDAECARPKAEAAARHLLRIDGESQAEPVVADLDARNIGEILDGTFI